jgi:hypothetical protein
MTDDGPAQAWLRRMVKAIALAGAEWEALHGPRAGAGDSSGESPAAETGATPDRLLAQAEEIVDAALQMRPPDDAGGP